MAAHADLLSRLCAKVNFQHICNFPSWYVTFSVVTTDVVLWSSCTISKSTHVKLCCTVRCCAYTAGHSVQLCHASDHTLLATSSVAIQDNNNASHKSATVADDGTEAEAAGLTIRSTKGFLMRASGGRVGSEGEEGELEMDAELAKDRELARHDRGRHLERLGWGEGAVVGGLAGPRAWELARDMTAGRPRKEELETMLCIRLGTLALLEGGS